MFFLSQLSQETQKQIKDAVENGISKASSNGITSNQFVILSLAIALSTYLSTVLTQVGDSTRKLIRKVELLNYVNIEDEESQITQFIQKIQELKTTKPTEENQLKKINNFIQHREKLKRIKLIKELKERQSSLRLLVSGDIILWFLILIPILINIVFIWSPSPTLNLQPIHTNKSWLIWLLLNKNWLICFVLKLGITLGGILMLCLHINQWIKQWVTSNHIGKTFKKNFENIKLLEQLKRKLNRNHPACAFVMRLLAFK